MRTLTAALLAAAIANAGLAAEDGEARTYFDEAKITVNERARADGFMRVRVLPKDGTPLEATLAIQKRLSENDLAHGIADSLNAALGANYEADRDAGEHVKIRKKTRDAADFSVEITFNAPGFAVILDN